MSDELKKLLEKLSEALSDSISESDRIPEAIEEIRLAGYDVFLVIEGTIGFSKREESEEELEKKKKMEEYDETHKGPPNASFTIQDYRFLDSLKVQDPDRQKKRNK